MKKKNISNQHEVLNLALTMSMEFGGNWLCAINERLAEVFPGLSEDKLNKINNCCKKINRLSNKYIYDNPVCEEEEIAFVSFDKFNTYVLSQFDWIYYDNMIKLYSQSCYYARK